MSEKDPKEFSYSPAQKGGAQWLKLVEDKRLRMSNFEKKWGCLLDIQLDRFLKL